MMKSALVWVAIIALVLLALNNIPRSNGIQEIPFSQFYTEGMEGKYKSVVLTGVDIEGTYKQPIKNAKSETVTKFKTIAPPMQDLGAQIMRWRLEDPPKLDEFRAAKPSENNLTFYLIFWGPLLVFVVLWFVFMRQAQMGGNKALSFGKARARGLSTSAKR
ncbi:MAG: ATP-dependent metallopeptidase FtsH/Yme1/Tma family protein, partial [Holophaga sp.]